MQLPWALLLDSIAGGVDVRPFAPSSAHKIPPTREPKDKNEKRGRFRKAEKRMPRPKLRRPQSMLLQEAVKWSLLTAQREAASDLGESWTDLRKEVSDRRAGSTKPMNLTVHTKNHLDSKS